jgi:hypothetical protein
MKAFPASDKFEREDRKGMDLRDYFAAQALPVLLNADTHRWGDFHAIHAEQAYKFADAMMKARGQG